MDSIIKIDEPVVVEEHITEQNEYRVVGKSILRQDGDPKVTGKAKFSTDISQPDMLFGKILFSDRPHARIIEIDTSKALALPGVRAVITAEDVPNTRYGQFLFDRPILARDRVRYIGDPVAAVAATSEQIALQAVKLIEVTYQDLPAVFEVNKAIEDGAPLVHPGVKEYGAISPFIRYGNVCMDAKLDQGDVGRAFAEADLVVENVYKTQGMHPGYLEPHACLAHFDYTGRLTIWTGTQQLSWDHASLARSLEMPIAKVRVVPTYVGGGFGGKLNISIEPVCGILA